VTFRRTLIETLVVAFAVVALVALIDWMSRGIA
jgi:hypothetical protein